MTTEKSDYVTLREQFERAMKPWFGPPNYEAEAVQATAEHVRDITNLYLEWQKQEKRLAEVATDATKLELLFLRPGVNDDGFTFKNPRIQITTAKGNVIVGYHAKDGQAVNFFIEQKEIPAVS